MKETIVGEYVLDGFANPSKPRYSYRVVMEGLTELLRLWHVKKPCNFVSPKTVQIVQKCDLITTFLTNVVGITVFIPPPPHVKQTPFQKIENQNETQRRQDFFQTIDFGATLLW